MSGPTPAELRDEFERLILTDLLGPSKPDEVVPGVRFMTGAGIAKLALGAGLVAEPDPFARHQPTLDVTPYRGDLAVKPI